ncbi:MAG: hypothetical protein COA78_13930 [Blastopirellula sp.]|nr:MAG: hypothetical protein COA78_13930 [Blastopirellula sp.]
MESLILGIPGTVALALVAMIGYFLGRRNPRTISDQQTKARRELKRANSVIRKLEEISRNVRRDLSIHQNSILHFKDRIAAIQTNEDKSPEAWQKLCEEAELMLTPTMRLSTQIAHAYDEIRMQANMLMTFTESRTDSLTGLSNRRALDESLDNMFAMKSRYQLNFSLAIFDVDHFKKVNDEKGHLEGDRVLQEFASLLDFCVRDTDIVTRYGGEEFVVLMPSTDLQGASVFAERLRTSAEAQIGINISGGIALADNSDDPRSLLSRADSALYQAKASGRNRNCYSDGNQIVTVSAEAMAAPVDQQVDDAEALLAEVQSLEKSVATQTKMKTGSSKTDRRKTVEH